MPTISRKEYAGLFGPTTGDKIRLGDTDLFVEIEKDLRGYGEEAVYGGGKSLRDGMGANNHLTRDNGVLDLVITNVTIVDAIQGVIKADVGIRDGKICGIGKSGNISEKISGTLACIGIRAFYQDCTHLGHGNTGAVRADDIIFCISKTKN